jgi:hypothetical protein
MRETLSLARHRQAGTPAPVHQAEASAPRVKYHLDEAPKCTAFVSCRYTQRPPQMRFPMRRISTRSRDGSATPRGYDRRKLRSADDLTFIKFNAFYTRLTHRLPIHHRAPSARGGGHVRVCGLRLGKCSPGIPVSLGPLTPSSRVLCEHLSSACDRTRQSTAARR